MRICSFVASALLAVALTVALASQALAQGSLQLHNPGENVSIEPRRVEIAPRPRPIPPRPTGIQPAILTNLELTVDIEGQVARTSLDQTFHNPNNRRLEGTYLFPLPANAVVSDLSLYIDGKPVKCEVLDARKARSIYEGIVRRQRDPALLEYIGRDLVKLRIFPIEAHQKRRVQFEYSQALTRDFGLTEYSFPLIAQTQANKPIEHVNISGSIKTKAPLTTVYSPTHNIEFVDKNDKNVRFHFEANRHTHAADLKIYYATTDKDVGANLLAYRRDGKDDGTFMLMIAPQRLGKRKPIDKDVTFVFDTSGSMAGEKIDQARRSLAYCLNSLREGDRFNIIRFSTEAEKFRGDRVRASKSNINDAQEFVGRFRAAGGTAINDALVAALRQDSEKGRPHIVVFLTDGLPTIGPRNIDDIVKNVDYTNRNRDARVFSFGVGHDVNTHLLDRVSGDNGGVSDYIAPKEDIELKVSNFFTKVSEPVLTDIEIDFGDVNVSKTYPSKLPDLFAGGQLKIVGRFDDSGKTKIRVTGYVGDKKQTFDYPVSFPKKSTKADFLPRLWAIRRVGHLVDEIRLHGESSELKEEVTRLGKKYAIATPYTSLLVLEDGEWGRQNVARAPRPSSRSGMMFEEAPADGMRPLQIESGKPMFIGTPRSYGASGAGARKGVNLGRGGSEAARAPRPTPKPTPLMAQTGRASVATAIETRKLKEAEKSDTDSSADIRNVGDRTFVLLDGVWTDSEFDDKAKVKDIVYGSDDYFDLLTKDGDIGKILALGTKIVFRLDDEWIRIVETAK